MDCSRFAVRVSALLVIRKFDYGEGAVVDFHGDAFEGFHRFFDGDFEELEDHGLVGAEHLAGGDAEEECVTDLAGGSRYNYTLLSVIMLSNLMAVLLQSLAVKLGIVTGRDHRTLFIAFSVTRFAIAASPRTLETSGCTRVATRGTMSVSIPLACITSAS